MAEFPGHGAIGTGMEALYQSLMIRRSHSIAQPIVCEQRFGPRVFPVDLQDPVAFAGPKLILFCPKMLRKSARQRIGVLPDLAVAERAMRTLRRARHFVFPD